MGLKWFFAIMAPGALGLDEALTPQLAASALLAPVTSLIQAQQLASLQQQHELRYRLLNPATGSSQGIILQAPLKEKTQTNAMSGLAFDSSQIPRLICFCDYDCMYAGPGWLCATDDGIYNFDRFENKADKIKKTLGTAQAPRRRLKRASPDTDRDWFMPSPPSRRESRQADHRRAKQTETIVPTKNTPKNSPKENKEIKSSTRKSKTERSRTSLPPMPPLTSPLYDEFIRRAMWAVPRSKLTGEKIGICIAQEDYTRFLSESGNVSELVENAQRTVPDVPSVFENNISASEQPLEKSANLSGQVVPIQQLKPNLNSMRIDPGYHSCYSVTKLGKIGSPQRPSTSDFAPSQTINYNPEAVSVTSVPNTNSFLISYYSEAFKYSISSADLRDAKRLQYATGWADPFHPDLDAGVNYPRIIVLDQAVLKALVALVTDLVQVASRESNSDVPASTLQRHLDPEVFSRYMSLIQSLENHIDEPVLYLSALEVTQNVQLRNTTLEVDCFEPGEIKVEVEISVMYVTPGVISALSQLLWEPIPDLRVTTIGDFLVGARKSFSDTTICAAKIHCIE